MSLWYSRPVLFVADIEASAAFYVGQLGFIEAWRYDEEGVAKVAQFDREGCQIIVSAQYPAKAGHGRMFISIDNGLIDSVRSELTERGAPVRDGFWGYRSMVINDPDGNELYFPYPDGEGA